MTTDNLLFIHVANARDRSVYGQEVMRLFKRIIDSKPNDGSRGNYLALNLSAIIGNKNMNLHNGKGFRVEKENIRSVEVIFFRRWRFSFRENIIKRRYL